MVVALIALFVSLGGSAYAALKLPANSVGTKQIQNGSVTAQKLASNAVNSSKVKDGSLSWQDLSPGVLHVGPQGPPGPQGRPGPQGLAGLPGPEGRSPAATKTFMDGSCSGSPIGAAVGSFGLRADSVNPSPGVSGLAVWVSGPDGVLSGFLTGWTGTTTANAAPVYQRLASNAATLLFPQGTSFGSQITASGHLLFVPSTGTAQELLITVAVNGSTNMCSLAAAVTPAA
jgi:hypothetical protein